MVDPVIQLMKLKSGQLARKIVVQANALQTQETILRTQVGWTVQKLPHLLPRPQQ